MTSIFTDGTLEPRVNTANLISEDDALLSTAISLKRIADALDKLSLIQETILIEMQMRNAR